MRLFFVILLLICGVLCQAETFTAIDINTVGNSRGYWEYLPTAYANEPDADFPIVIFFHGAGEGGNGELSGNLSKVLANGPPEICNDSNHALHAMLDQENLIVLSPQSPSGFWNSGMIRSFLDFALGYYRVDPRRIYLTGLSAGDIGINAFISDDPNANQVTAFLNCAVRGLIEDSGAYINTHCPYWALAAVGIYDGNYATDNVDKLAGHLMGIDETDAKANYPGTTAVRSAAFDPATGWTWEDGVPSAPDETLKLTMFTGNNHNSWDRTYNNANTWAWLLAQEKPEITILSPGSSALIPSGAGAFLSADAKDRLGNTLDGEQIVWSSNLDGELGTGETLLAEGLSIGVHTITCLATDAQRRSNAASIEISVIYTGPFQAVIDVGDASLTTPGNWNNLTSLTSGVVPSVISVTGQSTGAKVSVTQRFEGGQTGGVAAADIYPETAQIDTFYVGGSYPEGIIEISGLNPSQSYDFTLFASRNASGYKISRYTFDAATTGNYVILDAGYNTANSVAMNDVFPDSEGKVAIRVTRHEPQGYAYIGVIEISTEGATSDNQPPFVFAGPDVAIELDSDSYGDVALQGNVIDDGLPEDQTLSVAWSIVSQPAGAQGVFTNGDQIEAAFTADQPGEYELQFSADDGEFTRSDTLNLTVTYPAKPYLNWRETRFTEAERGDLSISGHDADPDGNGWANILEYGFGGMSRERAGQVAANTSMFTFSFFRDPSLIDLTYEIETSTTLAEDSWTVIARSVNGAPSELLDAPSFSLEESGHDPIEISVTSLNDTEEIRFYRINVTTDQVLLNNGVRYAFYEGSYTVIPDFSTLTPSKEGVQSGFQLTEAGSVTDYYAFEFDALIQIVEAGSYTFYTNSDDGSNLYINGVQVVDNDGAHGERERSGSVTLDVGLHAISVHFLEVAGSAILQVSYEGPGVAKQLIPDSILFINAE
ncbi:PA14 domain-containing protein [Cerasicoccus frondis]|uniref:PA14 domain-containing protein n=1 Tax=Cerasicoccus frondis TaxID=490090 RepID=UPI002852D73E|nr:PA14 domain-containing protein [Cerasicoccus frondis]